MEMSIDEAIEIINHYLDYPKEELRKALLEAISAMRKYKKIEEIYKNWSYGADSCDCMKDIEKVVEDGK